MHSLGMASYEVEKLIKNKLESNPDLKYYINNDYLDELIALLIEGIGEAIEENNRKIVEDMERQVRNKF